MAELQIRTFAPGAIESNTKELREYVLQKMADYEGLVYTEETIAEAKKDKAKLNALSKSLNDERIRRQKMWLEPFAKFKSEIDEIIGIIDKPIQVIDRQVKEYDERQKGIKQVGIEDWFENYKTNNACPEWLESSDIFNPKWLNATCSDKTWQSEITTRIEGILSDIETIQSLPEYSFEAMTVYKSTLNLAEAMREGKRLADIQKAKEAEQRAKELKEQEQKILADKVRGSLQGPSEAEIEAFSEKVENDKAALKKSEIDGIKRWWVDIRACVTMGQANDLKAYFAENDIEYTAITEKEVKK